MPWRAKRVGSTQSNRSMPSATASTIPSGIAEAHEVPRLVVGEQRQRGREGLEHRLPRLADREAADRVPVEADREGALGALRPQRQVGAALEDAELVEVGPLERAGTRGAAAPAHAAVRSTADRSTASPDGSGAHTSSTIWKSLPNAVWISTAASGVSRWVPPS